MTNIINKLKANFSFSSVSIIISILLIGGFNEFISCFLSAIFMIFILVLAIRKGKINLYFNTISFFIIFTVVAYLVTAVWAIDSGKANAYKRRNA